VDEVSHLVACHCFAPLPRACTCCKCAASLTVRPLLKSEQTRNDGSSSRCSKVARELGRLASVRATGCMF